MSHFSSTIDNQQDWISQELYNLSLENSPPTQHFQRFIFVKLTLLFEARINDRHTSPLCYHKLAYKITKMIEVPQGSKIYKSFRKKVKLVANCHYTLYVGNHLQGSSGYECLLVWRKYALGVSLLWFVVLIFVQFFVN
jgi:hypothetical protein